MRAVLLPAVSLVALLMAGCGDGPLPRHEPVAGAATQSAPPPPSPSPPAAPLALPVPPGVTAGVIVFDRQTGASPVQLNPTVQFRTASLVKLLIVLDHLWDRGPAYEVPAAERPRLDVMLRSSDDAAATHFWNRNGRRDVVSRMAARLGLRETQPPPAAQPGFWGYTATSAADMLRVYRYLLDSAPAPVRDYVMGNLHQHTRCGTDRYDQSFGIPSAFGRPSAVKQGWSGFGDRPANPCAQPVGWTPVRYAGPDMSAEVLHTTGTVGATDRVIVVVLSAHPGGTPFATAASRITGLTAALAPVVPR